MIKLSSGFLVIMVVVLSLVLSACGEPAASPGPGANAVLQTTPPPVTTTQSTNSVPPATTPPVTTPPVTTPPPQTGNPNDVKFEVLMAAPANYAGKMVTTTGAVSSKGTGFVMLGALKCETTSDLAEVIIGSVVLVSGICQVDGSSVTLKTASCILVC